MAMSETSSFFMVVFSSRAVSTPLHGFVGQLDDK
jgi:hypothetical protein